MRKHIGFILSDLSAAGGAERSFSLLANRLINYYDITAVSYRYAEKCFYHLDERIKVKSIFLKNNKLRERHIILPNYYVKLRKIINEFDVVVVVSTTSALGLLTTIGLKNIRIVTWEHTSLANVLYLTRKRKILQWLSAKLSNVLIQLTESNAKIAKMRFKKRDLEIVSIYNAISDKIIRTERRCNLEKRRIVTLARIDRVKGLDMLVDIADMVLGKHPDWRWDVYGQCNDEKYELEINEKLMNSPVKEMLHFHSAVSDVEDVLCDSSIYVMTSYYEGLPMSLLEAKAYGLPLVSFDCPTGPSEIITDGKNGDLVPCYDKFYMAGKINELIGSVEKRKLYSMHSRDDINKFSLSNIIKQWRKVLDNDIPKVNNN